MKLRHLLRAFGRNPFRRRAVERDLSEEMKSYLDLAATRKMRQGLDETSARREAAIELGGVEQVKERIREIRTGHFLEMRWQDLRYAFRALRKAPAFSLTVILVLGFGIGSTTLMFAIVNSVLLEGPRFPEANRLFTLWQRIPEERRVSFSPKEFDAWQKQTQLFEKMAFVAGTGFTISGRGEPELIIGRLTTPSLFQVLQANPGLGRVFSEGEANEHVVIVSDSLWREKLGARPDAVGEPLILNGEPYTIIGILPQTFDFGGPDAKLFVPVNSSNPIFATHPDAHFLRVIGRVKSNISRAQLDAEVNLLGTRVDDPSDQSSRRYFALSLHELTTRELRAPLIVLLAAVAFLLLTACANVANLTLARSNARQSEIAVRAALGASRRRLIAQLLTESALLAGIGVALGVSIAIWGIDLLRGFAAQNAPELLRASVDLPALIFALAVSALATIIFGLGPAFSASRTSFQSALKGTVRATSGSERTRHALVFGEIAIAALLLICGALMLRSFTALVRVDPGFRPSNVLIADLSLGKEHYPDAATMIQFYRASLEGVRKLPGVEAVGIVTHLPFGGNNWGNGFEVEGQMPPPGADYSAQIRPVSPGYFGALGIPLKIGHDFSERDNEKTPGFAIVNELFAKRFWPAESAIRKRIRYDKEWLTIIGVCGNIKHAQLDANSEMEIYVPYPQVPAGVMSFVGRDLNFVIHSPTSGSRSAELRNTFRALDPNAVVKITTMDALIRESTARPRFRTWLIAIFSGFALLLACLGIYGVIAYLVSQRYREIGIRLALGATKRNILELILGRTFRLAAAGVIVGLIAALFLARFLQSILYGVSAHDAATFIAVPLLLILVALLAGYFPARRATRIDPATSLRFE